MGNCLMAQFRERAAPGGEAGPWLLGVWGSGQH
jgi:hypothetical protein